MKRSFLIRKVTSLSPIILFIIFFTSCSGDLHYSEDISLQHIGSIEQRSDLVDRLVADENVRKLASLAIESLIDANEQLRLQSSTNSTARVSVPAIETYFEEGVLDLENAEQMLSDFGIENNNYVQIDKNVNYITSRIHRDFSELSNMEDQELIDVLNSVALQLADIMVDEYEAGLAPENWITDQWECSLNLPVVDNNTIGCTPACTAQYEAALDLLKVTASAAIDACIFDAVGNVINSTLQFTLGGFAVGAAVGGAPTGGIGAVPGAIAGAQVGFGFGVFVSGLLNVLEVQNCLFNQKQIFNASCNLAKANYYVCCEG